MMDKTVAAIKLADTCTGFGMTRSEVAEVLMDTGKFTSEETFLAVAAAGVCGPGYVCRPQDGNRAETCVQVLRG